MVWKRQNLRHRLCPQGEDGQPCLAGFLHGFWTGLVINWGRIWRTLSAPLGPSLCTLDIMSLQHWDGGCEVLWCSMASRKPCVSDYPWRWAKGLLNFFTVVCAVGRHDWLKLSRISNSESEWVRLAMSGGCLILQALLPRRDGHGSWGNGVREGSSYIMKTQWLSNVGRLLIFSCFYVFQVEYRSFPGSSQSEVSYTYLNRVPSVLNL